MSNLLDSLLGWNKIASNAPEKVPNINSIFRKVSYDNRDLYVCYDVSGSTLYNSRLSRDGMPFSQIYCKALNKLQMDLPDHKIICWSTRATILNQEDTLKCQNAIINNIPLANVIPNMNEGTSPENMLPLLSNRNSIIITDGSIVDSSINKIQNILPKSDIGSVFLIIIPHIDEYSDLYCKENVENTAKDNIRLSIPQAFSSKLLSVLVWNHKKEQFDVISELTTPWLRSDKSLKELFSSKCPLLRNNEFTIENESQLEMFNLDDLIEFLSKNKINDDILKRLDKLNIKLSIRQQGSIEQKNKWNNCIMNILNNLISAKINECYKEKEIPKDASFVEIIKISRINEKEKRKIEDKFRQDIGHLCDKLLIDKTVGEIKNISQAKTIQTQANVSRFQTMKSEDKLNELSSVLIKGDCSICEQTNINIFKTLSISTQLIIHFPFCKIEKIVKGKKGRETKINILDFELLKNYLNEYRPRFYYLDLCCDCAKISLDKAHMHDDPEYGITNIVPQNITIDPAGNRVVKERLLLFPFVDHNLLNNAINPNEPQFSFSRQWIRGFISKMIGLDPAGQDTAKACLAFMTKLATDKSNALLIYANQKSILRGGANDKYPDTVGRLFKPSTKPLSSETLLLINLVIDVIELAEIPVLPEANRLLLLCLIERNVIPLIEAQKKRQKSNELLYKTIGEIQKYDNKNFCDKFGIDDDNLVLIKKYSSVQDFRNENEELWTKFIATNLQKMCVDLKYLSVVETKIVDLLNAKKINDISTILNINEEYLVKSIHRANMNDENFIELIPKFINELTKCDDKDKLDVYAKFL